MYGGASQTTLIQALYIRGTATGTISANSVGVLNSTGTAWVKVGAGTELAFARGTWNSISVIHTNGTDQWAISLNGGAAITVTGLSAGTTNAFNSVTFSQISPSAVYFDTSGEAWQTVEQTVPIYGDGGNHPISLWMKTQNSKNSRANVPAGRSRV